MDDDDDDVDDQDSDEDDDTYDVKKSGSSTGWAAATGTRKRNHTEPKLPNSTKHLALAVLRQSVRAPKMMLEEQMVV